MIAAIYKSKGPTSHGVVDALRKITGERRVGHAGTLDPLAKGVLVVGIGREGTRALKNITAKDKEYVAEIRLGAESSTDDAEGKISYVSYESRSHKIAHKIGEAEIVSYESRSHKIGEVEIESALAKFRGKIFQIPPSYSAVKIRGKEAYKLARKGEVPELKPREVEIKEIEILKYEWPDLKLRVVTGPGVYIRALARDLGRTLGTGGYLADLERTRVGEFTKERAFTLEEFTRFWRE